MLRVLGLDAVTEAVYRLMLEHPDWGVEALAGALGTGRQQVAAALDRLADLALLRSGADADTDAPAGAHPAPGTGGGFEAGRPVPPQAGLEALLARREDELRRSRLELDAGRAAITEFLADYAALGRESVAGAVERVTGAEAVRRCLEDFSLRAGAGLSVLAPTGTGPGTCWDVDVPLHAHRLAAGVRVRILHLDSTAGVPERRRGMRALADAGAEIRTVPSLPLHLRIADDELAVLSAPASDRASAPDQASGPGPDPAPGQGSGPGPGGAPASAASLPGASSASGSAAVPCAVVIREPGALTGLRALFSHLWDDGTPFGAGPAADTEFSAQERALLRLLADGLTDEAVARKLGVSLRSERRMISRLSARFGTHSRFQLGQQAVRRGLL
ncbi:helix-turn-helix transcriptional regulator [Streptomyces sp. BR123]|uniref:helix-turn-helix transcriptional regulator n=1 Tax=Streptomyces sp. BR123 TaxID=2749828 RepID=UPI0015C4B13B|nr:helix-turn-helix transcriptional regulator [Streptomyces sp. BR123]NXY97864.1 helix-turn-helix transcriptional regulator [Streptomyces sp. BR123]